MVATTNGFKLEGIASLLLVAAWRSIRLQRLQNQFEVGRLHPAFARGAHNVVEG
jgi:hypothetical protein